MPFASTWMQPEIIILSEGSQEEKENTLCQHLDVASKIWREWTHLWNRSRFPDVENKLVADDWERVAEGME